MASCNLTSQLLLFSISIASLSASCTYMSVTSNLLMCPSFYVVVELCHCGKCEICGNFDYASISLCQIFIFPNFIFITCFVLYNSSI